MTCLEYAVKVKSWFEVQLKPRVILVFKIPLYLYPSSIVESPPLLSLLAKLLLRVGQKVIIFLRNRQSGVQDFHKRWPMAHIARLFFVVTFSLSWVLVPEETQPAPKLNRARFRSMVRTSS